MRQLLLDQDSYGGSETLCMFPLFVKRTDDVLAHCLAVVFRRLLYMGSFSVWLRVENVSLIRQGPHSSTVASYRPIFLTPVHFLVFERLVSVRLGRFMERTGVLPNPPVCLQKRSWHL